MIDRLAEERIAQLQARAHAQRLAAQLAMLEAREQMAPLRSAYGVISAAARMLSPKQPARSVAGALTRFGLDHPWLSSALAAAAVRTVRRWPLAVALGAGIGAAAWWLLRPTASKVAEQAEP